jgi:hypothetical protein
MIAGTCLDPYRSGGREHLAYHERNRAAGRMAGQIRMRVRYGKLATDWWDYLFMSPEELRTLAAGTRWRIEDMREDGLLYPARMRLT